MIRKEFIPQPLPFREPPFQSGIADPRYPLLPQVTLQNPDDYNLYKGLVDKQEYMAIIRANTSVSNADDLKVLLKILTRYAYEAMEKKPSHRHVMPLDYGKIPETYRVTVTVGLGSTLFTDETGFDRFEINSSRPKYLKLMPSFPGDKFSPADSASDFIILIASDHPYINVAIARYFAEYINRDFWKETGNTDNRKVFRVVDVQQGFGRPDMREFLRFNDGIDNLRFGIDLEKLVFVDELSGEPRWCVNGSYLVYRKIREMMPIWEAFSTMEQEHAIGREKESGKPLSREKEGIDNLTPVYRDPKDARDGPLNAHIRKVQPRRPYPDLFGIQDLERRFLRRPYPYFEGTDKDGNAINGLHFIAFMKSIQQQFEHVTNMWQMNPDFPKPGTGIDALYGKGVLSTVDGGYYFCPPAPIDEHDFIGSGIFQKSSIPDYKVPLHVYGYGITFIDIDETVFNTFSLIKVIKDGVVVRSLDNQQFNEDQLSEGESYDFGAFKDAASFFRSSVPINTTIRTIKNILQLVTSRSEGSRIVFLTARSDFDNKDVFLNTFRKYGIDIDSDRMFVERTGNLSTGTVAEKKKQVVLKYLFGGEYRRVRLLDDNKTNLEVFLSIGSGLSEDLLNLIRAKHSLSAADDPISFYAYLVDANGNMSLLDPKIKND